MNQLRSKRGNVNIPLAVLIVEDSESDTQLIVRTLKKVGYKVAFEQVETAEQMHAALQKRTWDIVISDFSLPKFDGHAALNQLKAEQLDIPFIVVSGAMGEESAVSMLKAGAHDYLIKGDLARLAPAVMRELKQAEERRENKLAEQALRESEEKYRVLVNHSPDNIARFDRNYRLLFANRPIWDGYEKLENLKEEQFIGKTYREVGLPEELCNYWERCLHTVFATGKSFATEYVYKTPLGVQYFDWQLVPELDHEGQILTVLAQSRDITERKRADEALLLSELDLREAQSVARIGNWKWNLKNGEIIWSDEMYHLFGIDKNSHTGKLGDVYEKMIHPDDLHVVLPSNAQAFVEKKPIEYRIILPDNTIRYIWTKAGDIVFDQPATRSS
jgi:PAS domain S-box-containing protein